jgi:cytochrome c oxidase subunit 2
MNPAAKRRIFPTQPWAGLGLVVAGMFAAGFESAVEAAGDAERGKPLYAVCATCHGPNGEGMHEMNAPALAGRESWYLVRQLENFKSGKRGGSGDIYGQQMAPMAQLLPNAQAIDDVAAYLSSLGN